MREAVVAHPLAECGELVGRFGWEAVLLWTLVVISGVALSWLAYRRAASG